MFTPKQYRAKAIEYGTLMKTSSSPSERQEYQELKQSFTTLANNEEWLVVNSKNTVRAVEQNGPSAALAKEEEDVLRYLGAALIIQWNTLPTKLRRELFDNASSIGELLETTALRGQIARFLHQHKNDHCSGKHSRKTTQSDGDQHAAAVARWDDEGGAPQAPANDKEETASAEERGIL